MEEFQKCNAVRFKITDIESQDHLDYNLLFFSKSASLFV